MVVMYEIAGRKVGSHVVGSPKALPNTQRALHGCAEPFDSIPRKNAALRGNQDANAALL